MLAVLPTTQGAPLGVRRPFPWTATGAVVLTTIRRIPVTIGFVCTVAALAALCAALGPTVETRIIDHASTNLHNLTDGHWLTLVSSAFLTGGGDENWLLVPMLAALLATAESLGGSRRLAGVFATGHVLATLVVAIGLLICVQTGWISPAVMRAQDVGVSYGCAAVLGALTTQLPKPWRASWALALLVAAVTGLSLAPNFTAAGHLTALCIGLVIAGVVPHHSAPVTPGITVLLGGAATFAVGIFGGDVEPFWVTPTLAGCAALVAATAVGGRAWVRRRA